MKKTFREGVDNSFSAELALTIDNNNENKSVLISFVFRYLEDLVSCKSSVQFVFYKAKRFFFSILTPNLCL